MKTFVFFLIVILQAITSFGNPADTTCVRLEEQLYLNAIIGDHSEEEENLNSLASCSGGIGMQYSLKKGDFFFNQERHNDALKVYNGIIHSASFDDGDKAVASFKAGRSHYINGDYAQAIQDFTRAEKLNYNQVDVRFEVARCYYMLREYNRSIAENEFVLDHEPENHSAICNLALNIEMTGNNAKALNLHLKADSVANGKRARHKINALSNFIELEEWQAGSFYGQQALKDFPKDPEIANYLGRCMNEIGDNKGALEICLKVIDHHPGHASLLFRIGYTYGRLGNTDSALTYYFKVLKVKPTDYAAMDNIGTIYGELGHFDIAHQYFDRGIELAPHYRKLYLHKQEALTDQYRFQEAYDLILVVSKKFPDSDHYLLHKGFTLMSLERYDDAIPFLQAKARLEPEDTKAFNNLGRCYAKLGQSEEAFRHFELALEKDPHNSYVYHNRASLYSDLEVFDKACLDLQQAMDEEYNFLIDSNLYTLVAEHCPDVNLNRRILKFGFKNDQPEYAGHTFIELLADSVTMPTDELPTKAAEEKVQAAIPSTTDNMTAFTVFPNPAKDVVTIDNAGEYEGVIIKVFNMQSQLVATKVMGNSNQARLDLSGQPSGTYIMLFSNNDKVLQTSRLVISK